MTDKKNNAYRTIGEVASLLNLVDKKSGKLLTHTIRFWEKNFKQIKPRIFSGKRRYYDQNAIEKLKKIQFLLKEKGMTIKGVKKLLNNQDSILDEKDNLSITSTLNIRDRLQKISNLIKDLKK